jgi:hypothetical protein
MVINIIYMIEMREFPLAVKVCGRCNKSLLQCSFILVWYIVHRLVYLTGFLCAVYADYYCSLEDKCE